MYTVFELLNGLMDQIVPRPGYAVGSAKEQDKILETIESLQIHFLKAHLAQDASKIGKVAVRSSQAVGGYLLNSVYEYNLAEPAAIYQNMQNGLCGFIDSLHRNFPGQFDYSLPMPQPIWQKIRTVLEESLLGLGKQGVSTQLIALIRSELNHSCRDHTPDYITGQYWQTLAQHLKELDPQFNREMVPFNDAVVNTLVGCNFNSGKLIHYVLETAAADLTNEDAPVTYWTDLLKRINRLPITPEMHLYRNTDSCQQQLIQSINTELFAAEQLHREDEIQDKLITGLSVDQFALLIRLMVDAHIFKCENINQLIRFFSRHVQTTRTLQISAESLRQRYYTISKASVKIMRDHLVEMMNKLKGY
ncbi:MAG: hypothetical protein WAZ36_13535 [Sediminibacterium sp.]